MGPIDPHVHRATDFVVHPITKATAFTQLRGVVDIDVAVGFEDGSGFSQCLRENLFPLLVEALVAHFHENEALAVLLMRRRLEQSSDRDKFGDFVEVHHAGKLYCHDRQNAQSAGAKGVFSHGNGLVQLATLQDQLLIAIRCCIVQ